MTLHEDLLADLERDEGFRSCAYQDSEGYWTIGHGILIDKRVKGAGITREESRWLMQRRLDRAEIELSKALPWVDELPEGVKRGLLNMAYNLGVPRLLKFKRMLTALKHREWQTAAAEALDSKWARQVGPRSARIAKLIRGG